jgi:hypothetical protein
LVSNPLRLSLNELAGKRSDEPDDHALFSVNRSWLENRAVESVHLLEVPAPSPPLDEPEPTLDCGHREDPLEPFADEPARDSKSDPLEPDAEPALWSKLAPTELAPQVLEPPPVEATEDEMAVPIEPLPLLTPAVVVAYSPIVCASARAANSASIAISATGAISFPSFMAFDLP